MDIRTGTVTGSEIATTGDGMEPGRVLQAIVTDLVDVQNVATCQAGDEYNPPKGVMVVLVAGGAAYKLAVALDDGIAPVMGVGGKRIYSTDATGENVMAEVRCHPDGKVEVFNGAVSLTLRPDGTATLENGAGGATLSPTGAWTFHGVSSTFDHPVTCQAGLSVTPGAGGGAAVNVTGSVHATGTVTGVTDVVAGTISGIGHHHNDPQGGQVGVPV